MGPAGRFNASRPAMTASSIVSKGATIAYSSGCRGETLNDASTMTAKSAHRAGVEAIQSHSRLRS